MRLLNLLERIGELPAEVWLLPPVVILLTMAAVSFLLRSARLRRYRAIAAYTGLSVKPQIFNASEVHGTFRGRPLIMTTVGRQRPTFRRRWTLVTVDLKNPEMISLHLWPQDFLDHVFMAAGFKELQAGDAEFDRRYVIRSDEPVLVTKMFQDSVLLDRILHANIDSVDLVSAKMRVYYAREERSPAHAEALFTAVTGLADAIDALKGEYKPEIIR